MMDHGAIPFPDISPELFSVALFGVHFALRWYALAYIVGILAGFWLTLRASRHPELWPESGPPMTRAQLDDLLFWMVLGVILGGRLGYVIFYSPSDYIAEPHRVFYLWEGGMAFHGGLVGVILFAFFFTRRNAIAQLSAADAIVLAVPPGLFLGRIANFINAELWGRPTDLPWGVIFPGPMAQNCGQPIGELCARHPSQLYEATLEGLVLGGLMIWLVWRRGALKMPGLLCGTFLAGYGIARILVEFVRQPDPQFISPENPIGLAVHVAGFGLTMGQLLSLPMVAIGLWLVWRAKRHAHTRPA